MKPLAMSLQLVLDEHKRLKAEIEIVFEDGTAVLRQVDANARITVHFEDLEKERASKTE